jgi:hypothetical protein
MKQDTINDMAQNDEVEKSTAPPYISFLTFTNFLTWLETEGVPLQFDGSFWRRKYSGSTGFQLMASLRFLGLLKGDEPQPVLEELVDAKGDERRETLKAVIKRSYSKVNFDILSRGTPKMLEGQLHDYGLDGDTLRKAESFFINACKFVDIPLSLALRKKARNRPAKSGSSSTRAKAQRKETRIDQLSEDQGKREGKVHDGQMSKVELASGGYVTLAVNVDLFQLSNKDREFVLGLVDMMKGYQKQGTEP